MKVTFDTNTLDKACRPERSAKDPGFPIFQKVHEAIKGSTIKGFYSVTMLTIEGIMNADRAKVFAGSALVMQPEEISITKNRDLPQGMRDKVGSGDLTTVKVTFQATQSDRTGLHPEVIRRIQAAKALGFKVLKDVPRVGAFNITDPTKEFYLPNDDAGQLSEWIARIHRVAREIEGRDVGYAQVQALGEKLATANAPQETWFKALDTAKDVHEQRAVQRAFREWADADSIAAHIAYGIDVFCSGDEGKTNAGKSILDPANRAWLSETYGVRFMTIEELAATLS